MRSIIFFMSLLASAGLHAATMQFDGVAAEGEYVFGVLDYLEDGYRLTQGNCYPDWVSCYGGPDEDVSAAIYGRAGGDGWFSWNELNLNYLAFHRLDFQAFALESIDVHGGQTSLYIEGFSNGIDKSLGSVPDVSVTISGPGTYLFGSGWEDVEVINIISVSPYNDGQAFIDNITTSIVPVPAALWLFGSALAGLGWIRRKQAA